jgi:hypothetical protein
MRCAVPSGTPTGVRADIETAYRGYRCRGTPGYPLEPLRGERAGTGRLGAKRQRYGAIRWFFHTTGQRPIPRTVATNLLVCRTSSRRSVSGSGGACRRKSPGPVRLKTERTAAGGRVMGGRDQQECVVPCPLEPLPGFGPILRPLTGGTAVAEPPATLLNPFGENVPGPGGLGRNDSVMDRAGGFFTRQARGLSHGPWRQTFWFVGRAIVMGEMTALGSDPVFFSRDRPEAYLTAVATNQKKSDSTCQAITSASGTSRLCSRSDFNPAWIMAVTSRISRCGTGSCRVLTIWRNACAILNIS